MNLYEEINSNDFEMLLENDESFMSYCPTCGRETTFNRSEQHSMRRNKINKIREGKIGDITDELNNKIETNKEVISEEMLKQMFRDYTTQPFPILGLNPEKGTLFIKEYECCLNHNHKRYEIFYFNVEESKIIKIAQYPSAYDIGSQEYLAKLKYVCSNKEAREMVKFINKALVMESFGHGIPALLYMRRAFERLIAISEDKNELKNTGDIMADRIKNNPLLPQEFKENKRIYNIISEGIHNETEEECMELFKLIKIGFTILLRKTYEHVQEQKEMEDLKKLVSSK